MIVEPRREGKSAWIGYSRRFSCFVLRRLLTAARTEFDAPQDQVGDSRQDDTQHQADQTDSQGGDGGPADGQLARRVPVLNVILAAPENEVLQDQDDGPGAKPVSDQQQEILQRLVEVRGGWQGD